MSVQRKLTIETSQKLLTLNLTEAALFVTHKGTERDLQVPLRQIIAASFDVTSTVLDICFLARRSPKASLGLMRAKGRVVNPDNSTVSTWVEELLEGAYNGIKRSRRLRVLVNPFGGVGKGRTIFKSKVEPILTAAGCTFDVTYTTHRGHAYDIAKDVALDYDAVVTLSGDGLIHEVLNGFAHHKTPIDAFRIPVSPIPTGSGNGLSLNLLGLKDGFDVAAATLNAIKGLPMKVDLFSITQGDKRTISFMSQALGLMAEVDLGTENWRWMGDTRFMLGFIRGVIQWKACPFKLSIKVAEQDKRKMADALTAARMGSEVPFNSDELNADVSLPALKYSSEDEDGWITFDKPLLYVLAGQGPYVGRDLMAFPVSLPNDGLIDITAQEQTTRGEIFKNIDGAPRGEVYWADSNHYFKAHAYRVEPLSNKGFFSVDGESYPWEKFQVEVHKGLGTFLSPTQTYVDDFNPRPDLKSGKRRV